MSPQVMTQFTNWGTLRDIHLVETSPAMRTLQEEKLYPQADKTGYQLHWHDSIGTIPPSDAFSMLVAHEFFDALPVHVLQVHLIQSYLLTIISS